jgi:hypothetical protein
MIIPAKRLMRTLDATLRHRLSGSAGFGSDESAILAALSLLENRAADGVRLCKDRLARLRDQIGYLVQELVSPTADSAYGLDLRTLRSQVATSETVSELDEIESRTVSSA